MKLVRSRAVAHVALAAYASRYALVTPHTHIALLIAARSLRAAARRARPLAKSTLTGFEMDLREGAPLDDALIREATAHTRHTATETFTDSAELK